MGILGNTPGSYNLIANKPGGGSQDNNLVDWVSEETVAINDQRVFNDILYINITGTNTTDDPSLDIVNWRNTGFVIDNNLPDPPEATTVDETYGLSRTVVTQTGIIITFGGAGNGQFNRSSVQNLPSATNTDNVGTTLQFINFFSSPGDVVITSGLSDSETGIGYRCAEANSSADISIKILDWTALNEGSLVSNMDFIAGPASNQISVYYTDTSVNIDPSTITFNAVNSFSVSAETVSRTTSTPPAAWISITDRLVPDPSTGTEGQRPTINAEGKYELQTPTGGGYSNTFVNSPDLITKVALFLGTKGATGISVTTGEEYTTFTTNGVDYYYFSASKFWSDNIDPPNGNQWNLIG